MKWLMSARIVRVNLFLAKLGLCGEGSTEERGCGFDALAPVRQIGLHRNKETKP